MLDSGRLSVEIVVPRDGSRLRHNASGDQPLPTLALACKREDGGACRYVLAAVHRLLLGERERPRGRVGYRYLDRVDHALPIPRRRCIGLCTA